MLSLSEVTVTKMSKILRSQSMIHNNWHFMLVLPMIIYQKLYIEVFLRWLLSKYVAGLSHNWIFVTLHSLSFLIEMLILQNFGNFMLSFESFETCFWKGNLQLYFWGNCGRYLLSYFEKVAVCTRVGVSLVTVGF